MQQLFGKTDKRRAYHLTVDFSDQEYLTIQDAIEIGFELSNMFFPEYQVLFGVHGEHTGQKHLDFDEENYLEVKDAVTVGYELSDLFFPGHQLIFSVHGKHTGQENLQLQFLINTVSIFGKEDLYINFDILNYIRQCLDWVLKNCI